MTAYPEGWLARELELCHANISRVTDCASPRSSKIGRQPQDVCAAALVGARL